MAPESLFAEHHHLADLMARRWRRAAEMFGVDMEDLAQVARVGLWLSCLAFDPERGSFTSFGLVGAQRVVLKAIRSAKVRRNQIVTAAAFFERCKAPDSPDVAAYIDVSTIFAGLPADDVRLLRMRFGLGDERAMTHAQIARQLGITAVAAKCRYHRALRRCRRLLAGEPLDRRPGKGGKAQ